jgi:uncharacterized protein YceK
MLNLSREELMKIRILSLLLLVFMLSGCASIRRQAQLAGQKEVKFKVEMKSQKIPLGTVEAQLDTAFLGLKKVAVNVTYSPVEDALCLEFTRNTVINYQFFHRAGRALFLDAVKKYEQDYDERNLVENKTSKNKYGSEEGYLIWKLTRISYQYHDNVDFSFGYLFKEKSPFFTITQGAAVHEDIFAQKSSEKYMTNGEFQLFLTRAQSTELAAFFDQQFLRGLTTLPEPVKIDPNVSYEAY